MKHSLALLFFVGVCLAFVVADGDYMWGTIGPNDELIAQDKVKKTFVVGVRVTQKYVFKQKDNLNALTITAIKVTNKNSKHPATCGLTNGGLGSKGVTLMFTSERGHSINDIVEIYGR